MQTRTIGLLAIFIALFSLPAFSQTTVKSKHPKMDAYYPSKQIVDTNTAITQTKPPPPANEPTIVTSTPVASTPIASQPVESTPTPQPTVTTTLVKITTGGVPVAKKVQTKPPPPSPYLDTRQGSSTPQYDTWGKNNNGAGSVTTSPK